VILSTIKARFRHESCGDFLVAKGILYQIYPRSFQDSNDDGIGDLPGIIDRMPYLFELGVDAVWLSPIFPSPMADFGYDISNYLDVDPIFGTLEDFDTLVAAAHASNLKVILDLVPNHTSDQHPWLIESRSSHDNPKGIVRGASAIQFRAVVRALERACACEADRRL
jgi:glycosidase